MRDLILAGLALAGAALVGCAPDVASATKGARGAVRSSGDTHRGTARIRHREERIEVPAEVRKKLKKQKVGRAGRYAICLVDGTAIREEIDPDFIGGGNPSRYGYVPHGEIWIERGTPAADRVPYALHEATEAERMRKEGLTYDQAHAIATDVESRLRKSPTRRKALERRWFSGHK